MATKTKSRKSTSKSDRMRGMYAEGKSVTQVMTALKVGYAFAYGVASRFPLPEDHPARATGATTYAHIAADRKSTKAVSIDKDTGAVTVRTTAGAITVHPDGKVTRKAIKA